MATIKLYRVPFTSESNYLFDDGLKYPPVTTLSNFPFIKIAPSLAIDINVNQASLDPRTFNYIQIQNTNSDQQYYYFVTNIVWKNENTLQAHCKIDVLNTYRYDIINGNIFSSKCYIERDTTPRFYDYNTKYRIDRKSEDIFPPCDNIVKNEEIKQPYYNFYLVKRTIPAGDITVKDMFTGLEVKLKFNSRRLYFQIVQDDTVERFQYKIYDGTANRTSQLLEVAPLSSIDRYDETIINITQLPFFPFYTFNDGKINASIKGASGSTDSSFELNGIQCFSENLFDEYFTTRPLITSNIKIDTLNFTIPNRPNTINALWNTAKNQAYEPKLYHSDFYKTGIYYNDKILSLKLEDIKLDIGEYTKDINIIQKTSANIDTSFLLDYADKNYYTTDINGEMKKFDNEFQLYTDAYINYMRNGYNYDKSARDRQTVANVLGLTASVVTTGASIALAPATGGVSLLGAIGGATSLTTGTVNTINNINQSNDNINRKIKETLNSTLSVTGTNSLSLQNYYSFKPKYFIIKPSQEYLNKIYDILYYTGYKVDAFREPPFHNRVIFDYIKMDIDLKAYFNPMFLEELKARFKEGVYIFHVNPSNNYDTSFTKENFDND